jgi:sortase A
MPARAENNTMNSRRLIMSASASLRNVLMATGLAVLAYAGGSVLLPHARQLELQQQFAVAVEAARTAAPETRDNPAPLGYGEFFGRIRMDRLGIDIVVLEGTGADILRRGAGHIQGTAHPGRRGNIAIAAHRDTFFAPLRDVRLGDEIVLTSRDGTIHRYRVASTRVVPPSAVEVLEAGPDRDLTLVTCYPFNVFGAAPDRFVVHATLAD